MTAVLEFYSKFWQNLQIIVEIWETTKIQWNLLYWAGLKKQDLLNFVVRTNGFLSFNDGDVFLLINLISDFQQSNKEPEVLDLAT